MHATIQSQAFICTSTNLHAHSSDSIQKAAANRMERNLGLMFNEKEKHEQRWMNGPLGMLTEFLALDSKELVFEDSSAGLTKV